LTGITILLATSHLKNADYVQEQVERCETRHSGVRADEKEEHT